MPQADSDIPTADNLKQEALRLYSIGRAKKSLSKWQEAAAKDPTRADLAYRLALSLLENAQVEDAVLELKRAIDLDPEQTKIEADFHAPAQALLTRRPTFKNLVKLRKQLAEGKPIKLREREPRSPDPALMPKRRAPKTPSA